MKATELGGLAETPEKTDRVPVLFVGHGSPMNAIEENEFSRAWRQLGQEIPRPKVILCISAHWETRGTHVTAMEDPPTIHDFGGFPRELFETDYPAKGSPWLAAEARAAVKKAAVGMDSEWGLDHGCWSVLKQMFPKADIPVVELSLDHFKPGRYHYELAKDLAPLRRKGVLILASGNLVHNLGKVEFAGGGPGSFNRHFGLDWALEASALFRKLIEEDRHDELMDYRSLGAAAQLAIPTPEHLVPLLYAIAMKRPDEPIVFFNDTPVAGSLTMTSLRIG